MSAPATFLYLNRENRWQGFSHPGLALDSRGRLRLAPVPRAPDAVSLPEPPPPPPTAPAGVAVTPDGSIYFSDPEHHRIWKVDGCDHRVQAVPCLGGRGVQPTQFQEPRGLFYHEGRRALFVVDSLNHRIQWFEEETWQLLGILGGYGTEDGLFDTPWAAAGDADGNLYVVDYGNKRVQKFDPHGQVLPGFAENLKQSGIQQPAGIAIAGAGDALRIFVLDRGTHRVAAFKPDGRRQQSFILKDDAGTLLNQTMGLLVGNDALYVGDNDRHALFAFTLAGCFVGPAVGYAGSVAALCFDRDGGILVQGGGIESPVTLLADQGYRRGGFLYGGPFKNTNFLFQEWHRITASLAPLPPDTRFQLFVYASSTLTMPPARAAGATHPWAGSVEVSASLATGACDGIWMQFPPNVAEGFVPAKMLDPAEPRGFKPLDYLWLAMEFEGEGSGSPEISQIRIDFNCDTPLRSLPRVYRKDDSSQRFLGRFLSLLESPFHEVEKEIADLALLFDDEAAPPEGLAWLASWLAIELSEEWDTPRKRCAIAEAFARDARRGTAEGLRALIRWGIGLDAVIEEPLLNAAWWSLPADDEAPDFDKSNSVLGFTTMLVSAEAQGAVVGSTAILDGSHLIDAEDFGTPLFADTAHQFLVQIYRSQIHSERQLDRLHALLDREKPAHTAYQICVIEPAMRIGYQATIGIDAIVAGISAPTAPAEAGPLVLGGAPPWQIGESSRLGQTTRLSNPIS